MSAPPFSQIKGYLQGKNWLSSLSRLQRNTLANFAGSAWSKALNLLFIPLYVKFLGVEAYGLVGFYITIITVFGLMDWGVSATLNREMARLSILEGKVQEQRDLLRTLEIINWTLALVTGLLFFWLAPLIAQFWLNPQTLSLGTVKNALRLMGFACLIQIPFSFYQFGLMGLGRQVINNTILGALATMQGAGVVLLLWMVSPTIECFLAWQIITSAIGAGAAAFFLWRSLSASFIRPRFRKSVVRELYRFSAGWTANAAARVAAFYADMILLSMLLPLNIYGNYALAQRLAFSLWAIVEALSTATLPKFCQLVSLGDEIALKNFYHRTCQFLSVMLMSVAVVVAMFSWEVVMLWTRNSVIAQNTHQLVSLLTLGIMLRGLAFIPFNLQVAYGWLSLSTSITVISALCFVPLIAVMASRYGALGAAAVNVVQNFVFLAAMPIMHYRLLRGEQGHWLLTNVLLPLSVVFLVASTARLMCSSPTNALASLTYLASVWFLTVGAAAMITPEVRVTVLSHIAWRKLRTRVD